MKRGFTLIEMLVVIGIIAILMAASMAAYSKMTKTADKAKAQELVHNVATALSSLYQQEGSWPKRLLNGGAQGVMDADRALPLAKGGYFPLNWKGDRLIGLDRLGILDPWGAAVIKRKGASASQSDVYRGNNFDHIIHYAIDADGDGIVEADIGGEGVKVRASAIAWGAGKDGKLEAYSVGSRKDDVYSWSAGQARRAE